ncbi:MAG: hypothetical protein L0Y58_21900, partial [Verrucomicrobia subdivision 3 bacterium]|nr:hypothetical protein [Limisphaerales bacterium]
MPENSSKRIWIVASLVALIVLAVGAWFWGRPAYHRYKAERTYKQARAFIEKGDLNNATLSLRQTLSLNPANADAVRTMAELMTRAQSPGAVAWWRRVVELDPAFSNKVMLAAVALRFEKPPFPIASETLEQIKAAGETNVAYHLVCARRAIRLNRIPEAQAHLQTATRLEPTNYLHQLNLAVLRLQDRDASVAEAAQRELTALTSHPKFGENALRSLSADAARRRQFAEAQRYSEQLLALPQANFDDLIHHLTILHESKSAELPAWIGRIQDRASTNAPQVATVAIWLKTSNRPREAL